MGAHIKDLTGQRFGKLTVVQMLDERKNKLIMYECQCDCGNTVTVSRKYLSKTTDFASCGCNWKGTNWPSDITGLHFGKLTALKPTEKRRQNNVVWACKCDCGNIAYVSRDRLVFGSVTSCGCWRKESLSLRQSLNLTGQRFGRLVAIRPLEERINTNIVWECKCDCGNTVQILATKLKTGYTQSCGCLQRETVSEKNRSNLAGKRFGNLTALEPTQKRHNRYIVWSCKCDCGSITEASSSDLKRGVVTSCGCLLP